MGQAVVRCAGKDGAWFWGRLHADGVERILHSGLGPVEVIQACRRGEVSASPDRLAVSGLRFLAPVWQPRQIICQGKNYLDHLLETGTKPQNKTFNILFTKAPASIADPVGEVVRPAGVELLDYEVELALVLLGNPRPPVHAGNLLECVGAIAVANDLSARDIQVPQGQWFKGKSFRGFCPLGPVLYVLEKGDETLLGDLKLELKVNGKTRQQASTKQFLYGPAETLTEAAGIFDFYPGDLLLTGTPGGVAMRVARGFWRDLAARFQSEKWKIARFLREQKMSDRYLQNGDLIEASIASPDGRVDLGTQRLRVSG